MWFSSLYRVFEKQGWGHTVRLRSKGLPVKCLEASYLFGMEHLPVSAEFPAACLASNLRKEKYSLACHPWNTAHPSIMPKLVFIVSHKKDHRVLHSTAQRGTVYPHGMSENSIKWELSSMQKNHISATHITFLKATDFLLLILSNHRRSPLDLPWSPLQPNHPTEACNS